MASSIITKRALAAEMKKLMEERPFTQISVSDICKSCGMNRKSFYYHFIDKYDLVNWIFINECGKPLEEKHTENFWDFYRELCDYMYANRKFYVNALHIEGDNSFQKTMLDFLVRNFDIYVKGYFEKEKSHMLEKKSREVLELLSVTFIASIQVWLERHPDISPGEYVEMARFDKLMAS